jgi:hypothetical protein
MFSSNSNGRIVGVKIKGVPDNYNAMSFGRQLDYRHIIAEFQKTAKSGHVGQKRKPHKAALRAFIKLNDVTEYYFITHDSPNYRDDSFEIWYKVKETSAVPC